MINWRIIIRTNSNDRPQDIFTQNTQNIVLSDDIADIADIARRRNVSIRDFLQGLTIEEVRRRAAEDWSELKNDPDLLEEFAKAVSVSITREKGFIPASYTTTTICKNCGEIPIEPSLKNNGYVLGCPWCLNRARGLPIPKLSQTKNNEREKEHDD